MIKKIIPFLIAIPAFILLFVFKIVPAINSLILSFKNYSPAKGFFGSPGVGTANFNAFFQSPYFVRLFANSFKISVLSIIITSVFALILIICISKMPNKWFRLAAVTLLAIPAFIPITSYVMVFMQFLSPNVGLANKILTSIGMQPVMFLGNKDYFQLVFSIMDTIRNVFIPVTIGVLACEKGLKFDFRKILLVLTGYILARVTVLLSPDLESLLLTYNPLVYEKADTLDTYMFRSSLMEMKYSASAAVWVVKTVIQLLINVGVYFILLLLMPKITSFVGELGDKVNKIPVSILAVLGYLLCAAGSLAVIVFVFVPGANGIFEISEFFKGVGALLNNPVFLTSNFMSLLYSVLGFIVFGLITLLLAYPMSVKTKLYPLILLIVLTLSNNLMGEYLLHKGFGFINTVFPVILGTSLSVMGAFALHFAVSNKLGNEIPGFEKYIRIAILPLVAIMVLAFIANWGVYLQQMIYLNNRSLYGVGLVGRELVNIDIGGARTVLPYAHPEAIRSAYIFMTSVIPVFLGIILIWAGKRFSLPAMSMYIRKN